MAISNNLEINDNQLIVTVNSKLYPLEAVYSAAYVFMDRAYIVLDGDPENEILVKIKLKSDGSLEKIGDEFNNELLNYADYLTRAKETKKIREMFLQRAIITNDPGMAEPQNNADVETDDGLDNLDELDDEFLDDPEGIAIPWEEKYGSEADKGACTEANKEETGVENEDKSE